MSNELRIVAAKMLEAAYSRRLECERRVWEARDEAAALRRKLADAEAREVTEQRVLDDAHEFVRMIWDDLRPSVRGEAGGGEGASTTPSTDIAGQPPAVTSIPSDPTP